MSEGYGYYFDGSITGALLSIFDNEITDYEKSIIQDFQQYNPNINIDEEMMEAIVEMYYSQDNEIVNGNINMSTTIYMRKKLTINNIYLTFEKPITDQSHIDIIENNYQVMNKMMKKCINDKYNDKQIHNITIMLRDIIADYKHGKFSCLIRLYPI